MKIYPIFLMVSFYFFISISCNSQHKELAIENCIKEAKKNNCVLEDAKIICPCLAPKLLMEYKEDPKIIEEIIQWNLSNISRDDSSRVRANKILRECILLPGISNIENYSDYPKSFKGGFKDWLKSVIALQDSSYSALNLEKWSNCIMDKIERKYSYDEISGDYHNPNFNVKKEILKDIIIFRKDCKEE